MGFLRPATPGFIVTLIATILLAVVTFCVPYFKSVYFLKANFSEGSASGSITLGTLGYCLELNNGTTCSKPSVGYEIDITALVGTLPFNIDIPDVVTKWITYALILHPVALVLACGSSLFGLLAHVREMSMACCSTCISGFAAGVALLAFIFDLVLFFLAKSALSSRGSAEMGNALWLTLAAWVMLFFSGCFYTLGRCCVSKRSPRDNKKKKNKKDHENQDNGPDFSEQLRLDAVKAEADRKARVKKGEGGLPAFYEPEHQPMIGHMDDNNVYVDDPFGKTQANIPTSHAGGGYVPGGQRVVDQYHNPSQQNSYPPQQPHPQRQGSGHSYAPSTFTYNAPPQTTSPPPLPTQYLAASNAPHPGQNYGHISSGTSYHSAVSEQPHTGGYSSYEQPYDPYETNPYQQQPQSQHSLPAPYSDPYRVASPPMPTATPPGIAAPTGGYYNNHPSSPPPERSYTLGGDGYGGNSVPPLPDINPYAPTGSNPYVVGTSSPTHVGMTDFSNPSSPTGLRGPRQQSVQYDAPPPNYSEGHDAVPGAWGKQ